MESWEERNEGRMFISDLGNFGGVRVGEDQTVLGQYAVWAPSGQGGHQMVEIGQELQQMMERYQIPEERVYKVVR